MSPLTALREDLAAGFPRVSGDEPMLHPSIDAGRVFSPRERG